MESNSTTVYGVWSEWDIGMENRLFSTKEKAWQAAQEAFDLQSMDETVEEAKASGLLGLYEYTVE